MFIAHKSYYTQIHKYSYNNDGKIEFLNTQKQNNWIDKIVDSYITNSQNEKIKKAITDNYYIEWLPINTKKIKGNNYTVVALVYELKKNETDFDIEIATEKYKLLNTLYIQLPSQKIFEKNAKKGKLEEWKP